MTDESVRWYDFGASAELELGAFDVILQRKDPPFDLEYIYACSRR